MAEELGQIERMEKLIGSLLRLEKLCADGYEFTFAEQAVRPLIENAWDSLHALWPGKKTPVSTQRRMVKYGLSLNRQSTPSIALLRITAAVYGKKICRTYLSASIARRIRRKAAPAWGLPL